MSSVLFFDPSCQRPYDTRTLRQQATGGTEASVTRIADALGAFVMQHNRTEAYGSYLPPGKVAGIEHVVLNRDSRALPRVRELYPDAKVYLWVHDQLNPGSKRGRRLASTAQHLRDLAVTVVCVSDSQRRGVEATLRKIGVDDRVRARVKNVRLRERFTFQLAAEVGNLFNQRIRTVGDFGSPFFINQNDYLGTNQFGIGAVSFAFPDVTSPLFNNYSTGNFSGRTVQLRGKFIF